MIIVSAAVFLFEKQDYGGRDKCAHFSGHGGIKEVSLCLFLFLMLRQIIYS